MQVDPKRPPLKMEDKGGKQMANQKGYAIFADHAHHRMRHCRADVDAGADVYTLAEIGLCT